MPSNLKILMNKEYKAKFDKINSMLFFDYQGIPADDLRQLRIELSEQNVGVMIIRNRVFAKAMDRFDSESLAKILLGPVAAVYAEDEGSIIRAAKYLYKFSKEHNACEIKGGIMGGIIDDAKTAKKYKDLLTREETLSLISGQVLAMGARLAAQIIAPAGLIASQIKKKGEE